jgi:hypothetical protein
VKVDITAGALKIKSVFARLPGKAGWPSLGGYYSSRDSGVAGPLGKGRSAAGILAARVFGQAASNVNVRNERGRLAGYEYSGGTYTALGGATISPRAPGAAGWRRAPRGPISSMTTAAA